MSESLQGQVALITGGSTELAGAIALTLAEAGVRVALCGRQADALELSVKKVKTAGRDGLGIESGLGSEGEAERVLSQVLAAYGRIDILILVSPFWAGGQIHAHAVRTWDLVLEANVREPFLMARAALPVFRAQRHGGVLAVASDSALGIYPMDGAYAVAMHGLKALMELIRVENAEFGVRTHLLAPGVAQTVERDAEGTPVLTTSHVAEWVLWLLTRPAHLRGNGPILI